MKIVVMHAFEVLPITWLCDKSAHVERVSSWNNSVQWLARRNRKVVDLL